jgi:hypothetical protein
LGFEIGAAVAMEGCTSADKSAEYIRIKLLGLKIIKENLAPPKFNDRPELSSISVRIYLASAYIKEDLI